MKRTFTFIIAITAIAIALFSFKKSIKPGPVADPANNLIVQSGQVSAISPRLYNYDTIWIKSNGLLQVNSNGSRWLVLNAKVIICDGTIEYKNFRRGLPEIKETLADGTAVAHQYYESAGGGGGDGSANGRKAGGRGFQPTDYNGGGGGSGAYYYGNPRLNAPGNDATSFRGAPSPGSSTQSFGGDGGRKPFGHGGLVCLVANKITFSASARIDLSGSDGAPGAKGGAGDCYGGGAVYYWGGGGGGGGTSGGNGGVLSIKCKDIVNQAALKVNVNFGRGGAGGRGGSGTRCSYDGQAGRAGDDGEQGHVEELK